MPRTLNQKIGIIAEKAVRQHCKCPKCKKRSARLKPLPNNFKCVDVVCDFCGYLAQVKGTRTNTHREITLVRAGGWKVLKERLDAGIYFPVFIVKVQGETPTGIYYVPADFLRREVFVGHGKPRVIKAEQPAGKPRKYSMFNYDFRKLGPHRMIEIWKRK